MTGAGTAGLVGALIGGGFTLAGGAVQNAWESHRHTVDRRADMHAAVGEVLAWAFGLLGELDRSEAAGRPVSPQIREKLADCPLALRREQHVRRYHGRRAAGVRTALAPLIDHFDGLAIAASTGTVPPPAQRSAAKDALDHAVAALQKVRA